MALDQAISDAEIDAIEARAAEFSDEQLLEFFTGMLQSPPFEGTTAITMGGASERSATVTRAMWCEIVKRWIPPKAFASAMVELFEGGISDPGTEGEAFRLAVEAETADAQMNRLLASRSIEGEADKDA
jgi:hypothetical protein